MNIILKWSNTITLIFPGQLAKITFLVLCVCVLIVLVFSSEAEANTYSEAKWLLFNLVSVFQQSAVYLKGKDTVDHWAVVAHMHLQLSITEML